MRVDPQDNIWTVDRGANMIIKFDPGRPFPDGVRPQARVGQSRRAAAAARRARGAGPGVAGRQFQSPDRRRLGRAGNIFVSDAYTNSRVVKLDKNGKFLKTWGSKGTAEGQFDMPNSIAVDAQGNVYVADLGNKRIQVFDNDGTFKTQFTDIGAPWAICISPGAHQYLYSSNSNPPDSMDNGEIYKMELDGKVLGKFGAAGKLAKEFGTVNEIDCRNPNQLYAGELTNWRVQKLTLHP